MEQAMARFLRDPLRVNNGDHVTHVYRILKLKFPVRSRY